MAVIYNILISIVVGASYFLGAILYRIAPEEVDPFLRKHKIFKLMGQYIIYQALILGVIFGSVLARSEEILSTFSLLIFLYALVAASIASQRKDLKKAIIEVTPAFAAFAISSGIISLVL